LHCVRRWEKRPFEPFGFGSNEIPFGRCGGGGEGSSSFPERGEFSERFERDSQMPFETNRIGKIEKNRLTSDFFRDENLTNLKSSNDESPFCKQNSSKNEKSHSWLFTLKCESSKIFETSEGERRSKEDLSNVSNCEETVSMEEGANAE
jgi:hypothetical protein